MQRIKTERRTLAMICWETRLNLFSRWAIISEFALPSKGLPLTWWPSALSTNMPQEWLSICTVIGREWIDGLMILVRPM